MTVVSISRICPVPFRTVETQLGIPSTYGTPINDSIHANLVWHASGTEISVPVTVEVGPLEAAADAVRIATVPIDIHSDEHERLFPTFGGTVEAVGGRSHTEIALVGRYRPPAGIVGLALDSSVLHRVAETALTGYLDAVAGRIEHAATAEPNVGTQSSI